MREYASKVGADFHEVKWFPDRDRLYNGSAYFVLVDFLKRIRQQDYYTEVLTLDCDTLIMKGCPNLFEMSGDLLCAQDQPWPVKDARYLAWLMRNFPASSECAVVENEKLPYFNSGVLLFRVDALRRMNLDGPYPNDYPPDQDYLNMRVGEAALDVTWLTNHFNQRHLSDRAWAVGHNHILHFIGPQKKDLMEFDRFLRV
jgi:hypothetical protein